YPLLLVLALCYIMIETQAVIIFALRIRHGFGEVHRIHDGVILQIARVSRQKIGSVFANGSAYIAAKEKLIVRRLLLRVRVVGVEPAVRPADIEHAMKP